MLTSEKYPNVGYDHSIGRFYIVAGRFHPQDDIKTIIKQSFPDAEGYVYFDGPNERKIKKKASILAYEMLHGPIPAGCKIYHKNLNENDFCGYNLGCISREEHLKLKDALLNTNGHIKLQAHPNVVYSYVLKYREQGKIKKKLCHDVIEGLKLKRKILIKSLKIIGKYVVNV